MGRLEEEKEKFKETHLNYLRGYIGISLLKANDFLPRCRNEKQIETIKKLLNKIKKEGVEIEKIINSI